MLTINFLFHFHRGAKALWFRTNSLLRVALLGLEHIDRLGLERRLGLDDHLLIQSILRILVIFFFILVAALILRLSLVALIVVVVVVALDNHTATPRGRLCMTGRHLLLLVNLGLLLLLVGIAGGGLVIDEARDARGTGAGLGLHADGRRRRRGGRGATRSSGRGRARSRRLDAHHSRSSNNFVGDGALHQRGCTGRRAFGGMRTWHQHL